MADSMEGNINPNIDFLYRTMLERDPHKRRVKPVSSHLLQLDFAGLDSSSDDSDFQPKGNSSDDDDDIDEDGDDDDDDNATAATSMQDDNDSSDDDNSANNDSSSDSNDNFSLNNDEDEIDNDDASSLSEVLHGLGRADGDSVTSNITKSTDAPSVAGGKKRKCEALDVTAGGDTKVKVLVCCVCLRDDNAEEMVECDNCYATVHEGCYGVTDTQSMVSSESSTSTEPWFCDACKAGNLDPHCELCPNSGGVYKKTDSGRWVHLVCALYVPGVAFGDVDKLSNVTLFEMSYYKWGAKACSLCEDTRFSRTGVCIGCDAGMCRTYFHVTCAQREGLLTEASPDEEIADPFYAYCKQHSNKFTSRTQRRNWLAVRSHVKSERRRLDVDTSSKARLQRKLQCHQDKYRLAEQNKPPGWVPPEKLPRLLLTNAYALRQLIKKAELLGVDPYQDEICNDVRKKWHIAPAFSTDYVSYYLDREGRISSLRSDVQRLIGQKEKLQKQEKVLHLKYAKLQSECQRLQRGTMAQREQGERLWSCLTACPGGKNLKLPESMNFRRVVITKSSAKQNIPRSPTASASTSYLRSCATCKRDTNQHLLARCDKCKQCYHLACLNPPLTRMPKKTRLQGWQCSECNANSNTDTDSHREVDTREPRRLRNKTLIRQPTRFNIRRASEQTHRSKIKSSRRVIGGVTKRRRPIVGGARRRVWPRGKIDRSGVGARDELGGNSVVMAHEENTASSSSSPQHSKATEVSTKTPSPTRAKVKSSPEKSLAPEKHTEMPKSELVTGRVLLQKMCPMERSIFGRLQKKRSLSPPSSLTSIETKTEREPVKKKVKRVGARQPPGGVGVKSGRLLQHHHRRKWNKTRRLVKEKSGGRIEEGKGEGASKQDEGNDASRQSDNLNATKQDEGDMNASKQGENKNTSSIGKNKKTLKQGGNKSASRQGKPASRKVAVAHRKLSDVLNRLVAKSPDEHMDGENSGENTARGDRNHSTPGYNQSSVGTLSAKRSVPAKRFTAGRILSAAVRRPGRPMGAKNKKPSMGTFRCRGGLSKVGARGGASSSTAGSTNGTPIKQQSAAAASLSDSEVQIIEISDEDSWDP